MPTLMYGSECWAWLQRHKRRVSAVEMRFLRGVCGYTRRDRLRNKLVYEEYQIVIYIAESVGIGQLHVERMSNARLEMRIYVGEIEGERLRGRPVSKWIDMIDGLLRVREILSGQNKRACMKRVMNVEEAKEVCKDRNLWRKLIAY